MSSDTNKAYKLVIKQRNAIRMNVQREIAKLDQTEEQNQILRSIHKLKAYQVDLETKNSIALDNLENEEQIDDEIADAANFTDSLMDKISEAEVGLVQIDALPKSSFSDSSHNASGLSKNKVSIRLPKLELQKFSGDPLRWQEFWDAFSSTIDEHEDLSAIDKFKYLKSLLQGEALRLADGYMLTSANYDTVLEALKDKYGNSQIAVFAHFEALLALTPTSHETTQLQRMFDECEKHIRSLVALGLQEETFGQVFTPIILSKLPRFVRMELHRRNGATQWTLEALRHALRDEIRARDMAERSFGGNESETTAKHDSQRNRSNEFRRARPSGGSAATLVSSEWKSECRFCHNDHFSDQCSKYPDVYSRKQCIKGNCFGCLGNGHVVRECRNLRPCFHCRRSGHHRSLCEQQFGSDASKVVKQRSKDTSMVYDSPEMISNAPDDMNLDSNLLHAGEQTILQTAVGRLRNPVQSTELEARFFFDTGGYRTFITEKAMKRLSLKPTGEVVVSNARFADTKRHVSTYKVVQLEIVGKNNHIRKITANVVPTITCPIQKLPLDPKIFPQLRDVQLAEPLCAKPEMVEIDVLIGSDYYYDFIESERIDCKGGLILLPSVFGYIATGRVCDMKNVTLKHESLAVTMLLTSDPSHQSLYDLERFWSLEEVGIKEDMGIPGDDEALRSFNESIQFKNDRYEVALPWRDRKPCLPVHFQLALGRLKSLLARIRGQPNVVKLYDMTIKQQAKLGIVEEAPEEPEGPLIHYIPHHHVVKEHNVTTKLRVVYDASARTNRDECSLNDCLHRGSVMLSDLCGLIMRFRLSSIAVVSDLEKAFLQVSLRPADRDVGRFLWVKDPLELPHKGNIITYRFTRVFFGAICSPFLLGATIAHHLRKVNTKTALQILDNVYVDNVISGEHNVKEACRFYKEAKDIFKRANMNLREWFSNSQALMDQMEESDRGKGKEVKVLGLLWNIERDTLRVPAPMPSPNSVTTKRQLLQSIAKTFDPCGYFSPVTVAAKMLLQEIWKNKYEWDSKLPDELLRLWESIRSDHASVGLFELKRFSDGICKDNSDSKSLHCFCDASAKAYGVAVYLVSSCQSELVFSKARVSPVKTVSIPRLELLAVALGSKCLSFVEAQLRLPIQRKVLWSDSQCVLHWIHKMPVSSLFVQNRVKEIRKGCNAEFRYTPSADNPADLSSRGCSFQFLSKSFLWWHGPQWIMSKESAWPTFLPDDTNVSLEKAIALPVVESRECENTLLNLKRFSSLTKVLRVTAWIRRFASKCRKHKAETGPLKASEMASCRHFWDKVVQSECFPGVLEQNNTDTKVKKLIKNLRLYVDQQGMIRSFGRITNSDVPETAWSPKILPKSHPYTSLIILDIHKRLHHAGVQHTLSQVRCEYWPVHGRAEVKRVIKNCIICIRFDGGHFKCPEIPPLPEFRCSVKRPFSCVGIDYLGPLFIRESGTVSTKKVWICLFSCATIRAIHLEVVENMSTDQLLMCLRRFVAQYGAPDLMISDNAKYFIAAKKTIDVLIQQVLENTEIQDFACQQNIQWKFIVEKAAWMGGFYERMVALVKSALQKCLHLQLLGMTELQTVTAEIAATLNSRPLIYVEADPHSEILTPAHFIRTSSVVGLATISSALTNADNQENKTSSLLANWKRLTTVADCFWNSWRKNYLLSLRERYNLSTQRNTSKSLPQTGMPVIIKDNLPRSRWKLGRITDLHPSVDGQVRSASVKLISGIQIKRSIAHLYPLEFSDNIAKQDTSETTISTSEPCRERPVQRNAAKLARLMIQKSLNN